MSKLEHARKTLSAVLDRVVYDFSSGSLILSLGFKLETRDQIHYSTCRLPLERDSSGD